MVVPLVILRIVSLIDREMQARPVCPVLSCYYSTFLTFFLVIAL